MTRLKLLYFVSATALLSLPGCESPGSAARTASSELQNTPERPPNIVIIFIDDMGYADVGCFGAEGFETPAIDRMAAEGMKFTSFYVPQSVCTASRAALITGCYPNRIGLLGAFNHTKTIGIHDDEMTIAELVKQRGYATAIYGKWHLGYYPKFLPLRHGFDEYYGLPYSNDMWPNHPTVGHRYPPLPLIEGATVIEGNPDQSKLTTDYTEHAVTFIEKNKDRPFLLYLPHTMVHVPLFVSEKFKGKSKQGLYGDVVMEIDWSVGRILDTLKKYGLDEHTLVIFTSDNGPWLSYGDHGGSTGPLREGKGTTWEGGVRVPCLMRWPGKIPAGSVRDEPAMTIDLLPTIAYLTETKLPDHKIDGKSIWPLMAGVPAAKSPQEAYYFYQDQTLEAVRSGRWKLHFPHNYSTVVVPGSDGKGGKYETESIGLALYNLEVDVGETENVVAERPEVVARLQALAKKARADLGDRERPGANVRAAGQL